MTAIFVFQHNAVFFKYQSNFWAQENAIKDCPFLVTTLSDEIRTFTGKALVPPAHKSIFTAAEKGRKGRAEDETRDWNTIRKPFLMTVLLPCPYSFRCCLLRASEQWLLMSYFCCRKNFSKLNTTICDSVWPDDQSLGFSTIQSVDLQDLKQHFRCTAAEAFLFLLV